MNKDERLEAAVKALREQGYDGPTAYRNAAAGIIVYDAVRAFDEQRKEVVQHSGEAKLPSLDNATAPAASPVGADPLRDEIAARYGADKVIALEQIMGASATVGADPPWLDEADLREIFARELDRNREPILASAMRGGHDNSNGGTAAIAAMKEAIRFAAAQPPSEEEIVARKCFDQFLDSAFGANSAFTCKRMLDDLLAAARVRAGG